MVTYSAEADAIEKFEQVWWYFSVNDIGKTIWQLTNFANHFEIEWLFINDDLFLLKSIFNCQAFQMDVRSVFDHIISRDFFYDVGFLQK